MDQILPTEVYGTQKTSEGSDGLDPQYKEHSRQLEHCTETATPSLV